MNQKEFIYLLASHIYNTGVSIYNIILQSFHAESYSTVKLGKKIFLRIPVALNFRSTFKLKEMSKLTF